MAVTALRSEWNIDKRLGRRRLLCRRSVSCISELIRQAKHLALCVELVFHLNLGTGLSTLALRGIRRGLGP